MAYSPEPLSPLTVLKEDFGWQVDAPNQYPELLYWPVAEHGTTAIHLAQSMAAIALAKQGVHVVLGVERSPAIDDQVTDISAWFIENNISPPEIVDLEAFNAAHDSEPSATYPLSLWQITTDRQRSLHAVTDLEALKIAPAGMTDLEQLRGYFEAANRRIDTPLQLWPYLHYRLQDVDPSHVMTLGGADERSFWEQWNTVYGSRNGNLAHLYLPNVTTALGHERLTWSHPEVLWDSLRRAQHKGGEYDPGHYFRWMIEQTYLLPKYVADPSAPHEVWQDIQGNLRDPDVLLGIAGHISDTFLKWRSRA